MSYNPYHWCIVPECKNTSVKTPDKLWIQVPTDISIRKTWLQLARRDPNLLSKKSRLYFCEDHFNLQNDMENYVQYKIMGSVKKIKMKPDCTPSKFDCQADRKRHLTSKEPNLSCAKKRRISRIKVIEKDTIDKDNVKQSSLSCVEDLEIVMDVFNPQDKSYKAVQKFQIQEHKEIEVCEFERGCSKAQNRNKQIQIGIKNKNTIIENEIKLSISQSTIPQNLVLAEENYGSDTSCTLSLAESMDNCVFSPYELSSLSKATSDTSSQGKYSKVEKLHLQSTLYKIKAKPQLYIGLSKELYFLIDLIANHTNIPEENVLLCLMKIKLNRTMSELADDFNLPLTQVNNIFIVNMPGIIKVLSTFIKQFPMSSIKKNLPIAFRQKYHQVTCIIDCLEIQIREPKNVIHQHFTWSENKKTNTIKYLISCTPNGFVNFVSNGYAGSISDVNLLEQSKFLENLQPGATILANKGFKQVKLYLSQKGFILLKFQNVPAETKLSNAEVKQRKQIANLRIHMEKVIHRLRKFGILKPYSVINSNVIGMLDLCITTACALINLQDALIK